MRKGVRGFLVRASHLAGHFQEAINGNPATSVANVPVPNVKKEPVPVQDLDAVRAAILCGYLLA